MKSKFIALASISFFAITAPSAQADPIWRYRHDGGLLLNVQRVDSVTGAIYDAPHQWVRFDKGFETHIEDGNLNIYVPHDRELYTFYKDSPFVTRQAIQLGTPSEWVTVPNSGSSKIVENTDRSLVVGGTLNKRLKIGTGTNPTTIHETGLEVGGENLIRRSADGAVHIGKNSLVTIEEGGRQKMWATNAAGESIDIDITNGSRLLINGRDVEKSIDNVGALSAALGSVPAISADSPFTCGFGAGTHSSAYALSAGCASRVSDRVSLNAALATVINNHTGDKDDNLSARAGFTFKLGKVDDSPKVAAKKAAALHDEVAALRGENLALMARLERLEAIALGQNPAVTKVSLIGVVQQHP